MCGPTYPLPCLLQLIKHRDHITLAKYYRSESSMQWKASKLAKTDMRLFKLLAHVFQDILVGAEFVDSYGTVSFCNRKLLKQLYMGCTGKSQAKDTITMKLLFSLSVH